MFAKLKRDLDAIIARDPAAGGRLSAMFLYPSFQVMFAYRIANPLWRLKLRFLARFIMQVARWFTGIEIHPGARIGCGFFVDHGSGVVVGETSVIGGNVTLYQGVTLGGVMPAVDSAQQRTHKRHPTLEDDVIIGSGAQVLGDITVKRGARVGGNSVVTKDVPAGVTVVGVPARQLASHTRPSPDERGFAAYGVADCQEVDPQDRTMAGLLNEVQSLRARVNVLEDRLADTPVHDEAGKAGITDRDDAGIADADVAETAEADGAGKAGVKKAAAADAPRIVKPGAKKAGAADAPKVAKPDAKKADATDAPRAGNADAKKADASPADSTDGGNPVDSVETVESGKPGASGETAKDGGPGGRAATRKD